MSKTVWVSWAMMNEALIKPLDADVVLADIDGAIETIKRNDSGEPLPADGFPKEIYGDEDAGILGPLTGPFYGNGFWVVSSEIAAVLRQFDLGQGALYPVKLFQKDKKTPVEGEYFCLNFGNVKQSFLPEHSPDAMADRSRENIWTPGFVLKDNDIAVSPIAFEGPDIWIDPVLERAFFVSDALAKALQAAKANGNFGLRKCRIIENS